MKHLFLASSGLEYIKEFVGRSPSQVNVLFIPTAGNPDTDVWWIDKDRDVLTRMGFHLIEFDIAGKTKAEISEQLSSTDMVYVAGGYTFYLLKQIRDTGFDALLTEFIDKGGLYAGASAGMLVVGPDIAPIASIDEPEKAGGRVSSKGLGFIDIVPIPHYDMRDRTAAIDDIKQKYGKEFEIVLLTDDQAIVVEGNSWKIVESKRSLRELEWFKKNHV